MCHLPITKKSFEIPVSGKIKKKDTNRNWQLPQKLCFWHFEIYINYQFVKLCKITFALVVTGFITGSFDMKKYWFYGDFFLSVLNFWLPVYSFIQLNENLKLNFAEIDVNKLIFK